MGSFLAVLPTATSCPINGHIKDLALPYTEAAVELDDVRVREA